MFFIVSSEDSVRRLQMMSASQRRAAQQQRWERRRTEWVGWRGAGVSYRWLTAAPVTRDVVFICSTAA